MLVMDMTDTFKFQLGDDDDEYHYFVSTGEQVHSALDDTSVRISFSKFLSDFVQNLCGWQFCM